MKLKNLFITALFVSLPLTVYAQTEDEGENWMSFDKIVSELSTTSTEKISSPDAPSFDTIKLHAGLGLATSYVFLSPEGGPRVFGFLRGFEANFGIDLFSRYWMAEGSLRNFGTEELRKDTEASLKEFDLKLVYHDAISKKLGYKVSGGMAARYLEFKSSGPNGYQSKDYSTPSAILATGIRAKISNAVTIGTDVGYRWALVEDTIDESAIDAAIRLDAHF